jgi:hypothetical protein
MRLRLLVADILSEFLILALVEKSVVAIRADFHFVDSDYYFNLTMNSVASELAPEGQ